MRVTRWCMSVLNNNCSIDVWTIWSYLWWLRDVYRFFRREILKFVYKKYNLIGWVKYIHLGTRLECSYTTRPIHGRVVLVPFKKWLVHCELLYTGPVTFYKVHTRTTQPCITGYPDRTFKGQRRRGEERIRKEEMGGKRMGACVRRRRGGRVGMEKRMMVGF